VRLIVAGLDTSATPRAQQRPRCKAHKAGRTATAAAVMVPGWFLLITMLEATLWSSANMLSVYRVHWQVKLVLKK
jgi:hypothetical protein